MVVWVRVSSPMSAQELGANLTRALRRSAEAMPGLVAACTPPVRLRNSLTFR